MGSFSNIFISFFLPVFLFFFPAEIQQSKVFSIRSVDPLVKVLERGATHSEAMAISDIARGEHATFQFVLNSPLKITGLKVSYVGPLNGKSRLSSAKIGYIGYVKLNKLAERSPARDQIARSNNNFPDPIYDRAPATIIANSNQSVLITIPIPLNQMPGVYTGKIVFSGINGARKFTAERTITVAVYGARITNNKLLTSNWCFRENNFDQGYSKLKYMNNGRTVVPYSPRYWELVEIIARNMQEYRQNVFYISPLMETSYSYSAGKYNFNFSNFDRLVTIYKKYGVAEYIEGGHLGGRAGAWDAPLTLNYMEPLKDGSFNMKGGDVRSPAARIFYSQFMPALVKHLKEKGWYDKYYQHLIDEPRDSDSENYIYVSKLMKGYAPDLKVVDALSTTEIKGNIDVWVPQLDFLKNNALFFSQRKSLGESVWFYTCWLPQGNFANRFIELPGLKNRLLPWISYKYGITGNLNWGYNYWVDNPALRADRLDGSSVYPGGDSWLVYPKYNGLYSSIRQEHMRAGSYDYDLLYMLGQKNPGKANNFVNRIIYNFDDYNMSIKEFRMIRKQILEELSK